jgi:pSer/pThr/pTyr-binding forkhead associated (FHA) protein
MDEYLDVKIDVFEHVGQRARLRKNLTVTALIEEILREFDDIAADSPDKYAIYLKGFDRPLTRENTMTQLDLQPQDELVFDYLRQTIRRMLDVSQYAVLRDDSTGKEFDIQWQPAVIGRPSTDVDHNIILAVNVQLLPNGQTVSRKHAQITVSEGRYFIEPLVDQNPVFLNGKELPFNSRREIRNGDKIALGRHRLTMTFVTRPQGQRDSRQSVQDPIFQSAPRIVQDPSPSFHARVPSANVVDATSLADSLPLPVLVIEAASSSDKIGKQIELITFPFSLGRSLESLSKEEEVSRRHAEITYDPQAGKYYITDLNSTNGLTLNGQRIVPGTPHEITTGARIGLGSILVLRLEA